MMKEALPVSGSFKKNFRTDGSDKERLLSDPGNTEAYEGNSYTGFFKPGLYPILRILAGALPLIFLALFYFYPLGGILLRSFSDQSSFSMLSVLKIVKSSRMASILWFTLWQAALSTLLTLSVALPCAYVMGSFNFRGKKLLLTIATIPFVLPTIVVAASFKSLAMFLHSTIEQLSFFADIFPGLQKALLELVNPDHSLLMILAANMFYNFSVIVRITSSFWSAMGKDMREAASMLGAAPLPLFFKVTLPLLKPALMASSLLVFMFCFSSFGVILILGGPSYSTLEVEIYRQAAHLFNLPIASTLSLFQIIFTFAIMYFYSLVQKKHSSFTPESEKYSLKKPSSSKERLAVLSATLFILVLALLPISTLFFNSLFHEGSLSLIYYRELFQNSSGSIFYVSPIDAVSNSFLFAAITLMMALIVGTSGAYLIKRESKIKRDCKKDSERNSERDGPNDSDSPWYNLKYARSFISAFSSLSGTWLEPVFMLPLSTSAVTLGFGMIITLDSPPLNLRTSIFLIPIVHTLVAFPFVVRALLPALRSIPSNLRESALVIGASPLRVWFHVELPIIARALSVGAVFAFTISLGEFGATLFAARPEFTTVPVAIYRFLGQPGAINYGQAMAMSSILTLVTAAGFLFIENMRKIGSEGF